MSDILTSVNRSPIEWVEIDQPICANVYGSAPCTAVKGVSGTDKCFNTRKTCQDPANYDQSEIITLRFCHNRGKIPDDEYYFPYLQSAKVSPSKINPGGSSSNSNALGTRATLNLTFSDHPHTDRIVDPYLDDRDYDPYERSTFWAKWRARNPFYMHRVVRHISGFINDDLTIENKVTRTFFLTSFNGATNSGSVSISAKDVLSLAFNKKAKAPAVNTGKLIADITDVDSSLTLIPAGIGNDEYAASGKIRIDNEVCAFTRVADVVTLTSRGIEGTTAAAHSTNAAVQECLEYVSKAPDYILNDLLANYSGVSATYLDTAQWATEVAGYMPNLYSTVITEPTGVTDLINEISEQMYFTAWWDDRNALLKIRALRPVDDESVTTLTDDANLLSGSIQWADKADELITQVWVFYAQKDKTKKLDEPTNYSAIDIIADNDAESEDKHNTVSVKQVFSRWMNASDGANATDLGNKTLARYNNIPREVVFSLDAKDSALWLTDFITVQNRNNVDSFGVEVPVPMQVISASEEIQGTKFKYIAQEYTGEPITDPDEILIDISADLINVNLRTLFDSLKAYTPISGDKIRFTIRSGATVGGSAFTANENIDATAASSIVKTYTANYLRLGASATVVTGTAPILQRKGLATARSIAKGATYTSAVGATNWGAALGDIEEVPLSTAITRGTWPAGVELFLDIQAGAHVLGEGGSGSFISTGSLASQNLPGGDGGNALDMSSGTITIDNLGIIAGGGGAGGSIRSTVISNSYNIISGGGGAGFDTSLASVGDDTDYPFNITTLPAAGSKEITVPPSVALGGKIWNDLSGDGGDLASDGELQTSFTTMSSNTVGKAGAAVSAGSSNITYVNKGDLRGAEI